MRRRLVRCLALAAAAFAASTWALRTALPPFDLPGTSIKLEALREPASGEPFDTVMLGTSRTWYALDPAAFDAAVARHGGRSRTFNLGVQGQAAMGCWQTLARLADDPPPGLRWVLLDPEALFRSLRDRQPLSRGTIGWHFPHATWVLLRLVSHADATWIEKAEAGSRHLHSFLYNLLNVGLAAEPIRAALGAAEPPPPERRYRGQADDGFVPMRGRAAHFSPGQPSWARLQRRRDQLREDPAYEDTLSDEGREYFEAIIALVESMGAVPVFVCGPSINSHEELIDAHAKGVVPHLLRLDRSDLHPGLYANDARFDHSYVNEVGARRYSEALGELFAELQRELGGP